MSDIKEWFEEGRLTLLPEVDSTNNYAKALAVKGAPHGSIVIAETQTAGKGRMGRRFVSPKGTGLYMTLILRPDCAADKLTLLTPLAAVAAANAVDRVCGVDTGIKWVNDVYLNGRKFVGILTEGAFRGDRIDYALMGIGVNVGSIKGLMPEDIAPFVTSIEDETGVKYPIGKIASEISGEVERLLSQLRSGEFIKTYRDKSCVIGREVRVTRYTPCRTGKAVGIAHNGGLTVQYPDGSVEIVMSGEAEVIKQKDTAFYK